MRRAVRAGLVAQVVAVAHERIDGAHGPPLLRRKQEEGIVEVLRAGARHAAAVFMRSRELFGHAARENATRANEPSSRPTRSGLEIAGRAASTL